MATGPRRTAAPCVERLEARDLLAAGITARLAGGVLRINGTEGKDTIHVRQLNQQLKVDRTPIQTTSGQRLSQVAVTRVSKIEVRARGGDDLVQITTTVGRNSRVHIPTVIVWAGAGNDRVLGGAGKDLIYGDGGNDTLDGRGGDDRLLGGAGNDRLLGGGGRDVLLGEAGNDVLSGGADRDILDGGAGNDVLLGGSGDDRLEGGTGRNRLRGEQGNDLLISSNRLDEVQGGPGRNTIRREYDNAGSPRPQTSFQKEVNRMLELVNQHRRQHGRRALRFNSKLAAAARYQSGHMARTGHYSHTNRDGRDLADRLAAADYDYRWAGENIHRYNPASRRTTGVNRDYPRSQLADYFVDGWKVSPAHNANLLHGSPMEAGIALAQAGNGLIYATLVLGQPG